MGSQNGHDVVPLGSARRAKKRWEATAFPFLRYFPQLFFIAVTHFPTGFRFLMCRGIYLEFIIAALAREQPLSGRGQQIDGDMRVLYVRGIIKHVAAFMAS